MVSADSMECCALSEILPRRDAHLRKKVLLSGKSNTKFLTSANLITFYTVNIMEEVIQIVKSAPVHKAHVVWGAGQGRSYELGACLRETCL